MVHIDQTFVIGVVSGAIGSIIAAAVIFLITRAAKPLIKHINAPAPLTVEAKVKIAEQLQLYDKAMARLNHMDSNPKDLYLYLLQMTIVSFLLLLAALLLLSFPPQAPNASLFVLSGLLLFLLGTAFSITVIFEAEKMSAKKIGQTRMNLQAAIDDAKSKLGLPLVAIISPGQAPSAAASEPPSQSTADGSQ
jgi:hypothetical protein